MGRQPQPANNSPAPAPNAPGAAAPPPATASASSTSSFLTPEMLNNISTAVCMVRDIARVVQRVATQGCAEAPCPPPPSCCQQPPPCVDAQTAKEIEAIVCCLWEIVRSVRATVGQFSGSGVQTRPGPVTMQSTPQTQALWSAASEAERKLIELVVANPDPDERDVNTRLEIARLVAERDIALRRNKLLSRA